MATTNKTEVEDVVAAAEDQLGDEFEGEDLEAPVPEVAAPPTVDTPAAADDIFEMDLPADRLPGHYKNKFGQLGRAPKIRDLVAEAFSAEDKIRRDGEVARTERERAGILAAQVAALQDMLRERNAPPPRAATFGDFGVPDPNDEILREGGPERVARAAADMGARTATERLNPQIQALQQTVQGLQNQLGVMTVRDAAERARTELGVDSATWEKASSYLHARAGYDPRGPNTPDAWKDAYIGAKEAFPSAEPRTTLPREGIVKGNPSGSSRVTPVRATQGGRPRVRGLVNALVDDAMKAGLSREQAEEVARRAEEKLRQKEAS